ncbi:MAG TPA: fasciclin domain-containing protein [Chitinophagaceae bacterium]|nr:fasciclin domain-containing protein [Chitinophagaceae bacterium]
MERQKSFLTPMLSILASGLLLAACNKDNNSSTPPPTDNTITGIVVASADFSTLKAAVVKADLATTLSGTGPYTVFAPDNAAFTASGIDATALNALTADQTKAILLYHTLPAKVMAADVPAGPNAKVITAGGDSVFVTKNGNGVFVNGIKVTQADISASNGVIHRIGRVLLPPAGNIVETAQAAGLDSLVKAVTLATTETGGDPNLASTLGSATLTVFAPTNQAFTDLLAALNLHRLEDIPVATLLAVLRYHVVGGRAFSSDLANGNLAMLAGGNTTIGLTNGSAGGPTITGNGNGGNKSNIVATNIVCRNGVVHLIDRVLLP